MEHEVDMTKFAAMIRTKRGDRGLRSVAAEIGEISASTLSRIEGGHVPDLDTYFRLCRWLGVSPEEFAASAELNEGEQGGLNISKKDLLMAHLRADKTLPPDTVSALSQMIQLAYQQSEWLIQHAQWK